MMTVRIASRAPLLALLMALMFAPLAPAMIGVEEAPASNLEPAADLSELLDMEQWSAAARAGATSWLHETADDDGNTGQWTSSAITDDGTIWVAYYGAANRDLKVAEWRGWTWTINTVYSFGDIGKYTEIEIDSATRWKYSKMRSGLGTGSREGVTITPAAPNCSAIWLKSQVARVPAWLVPTMTGNSPPALTAVRISASRS